MVSYILFSPSNVRCKLILFLLSTSVIHQLGWRLNQSGAHMVIVPSDEFLNGQSKAAALSEDFNNCKYCYLTFESKDLYFTFISFF
jgi:hypothetical protein